MKNMFKKTMAMIALVAVIFTNIPVYIFATEVDTSRPTMTISAASSNTIEEGGTVSYNVSVTDNVGVTFFRLNTSNITPVGFSATVTVTETGDFSRRVTFSNIVSTSDSTNKYFTVAAEAAKDLAGNYTPRKTSPAFKIQAKVEPEPVKDTSRPTITISAASASKIVEGGTVTYTIGANDNVGVKTFNITTNDITPVGFTATISVSGTASSKTVTFSNIKSNSTAASKYFTLAAGVAKDVEGNTSAKKTSPAFTIKEKEVVPPVESEPEVKDTSRPAITISAANPQTIVEGGTASYTIGANDNVGVKTFNITTNDITPVGFTATISVTGTASSKTVTFSNIKSNSTAANKYFTLAAGVAKDAAGNTSAKKTSPAFSVEVKADPEPVKDTSRPAITISASNPQTIVEGGTVTYTIGANDNVGVKTFNITTNDITPVGFTATVSVSGTASSKTVTFSNIKSNSTAANKYFTLAAGVAKDAEGNASAKKTSPAFQIVEPADTSRPAVTISAAKPSIIYKGETVRYTIAANDNVKVTSFVVTAKDITPVGFTADIAIADDGNVKVVTFTNVKETTASANKYFTLAAGVAKDAEGNASAQKTSPAFTIKEKEVVPPVEPEPEIKDTIPPVVTIGAANPKSIYAGGTVKYNVTFKDNVKVTDVNLIASKIEMVGFTADVSVTVDGVKSAVVTLKNIKGNIGVNKYIKIASGVALDEPGNRSAQAISPKFSIVQKTSTIVTKPTTTKYTVNCIDDLSLLGDINKEITYFASWLRAEKYTATHVQENNYAAEGETMTYMVEYYNGSTAPAPNVTFELTIPYKVDVEEINGNGKITKRTDNETVITWNIGTVPSYVASKGTGYCRLYVRVKFLENKALEKSANISEVFYPTLKTTASGNNSYSYMRQLFIDTTEGKTGTYTKYLTTVDTTNQARPDDEITRAEFAKLLADSGILDVVVGSNDYKTFKDHETIPAYARDAVSALAKTDIIQAFPDGTFKPNNPILMEDAMQMLAQAATYMSEQKLTVYKPVFLYTEALIGTDKKVSPKKDYIMELMRQNVVVKYESNPDSYALRKDVVSMVNSLTFRGPYVETLPENTLKFADIRDDSVFFYNIVGASNSYKYTYDYRLWQQIVEIEK